MADQICANCKRYPKFCGCEKAEIVSVTPCTICKNIHEHTGTCAGCKVSAGWWDHRSNMLLCGMCRERGPQGETLEEMVNAELAGQQFPEAEI